MTIFALTVSGLAHACESGHWIQTVADSGGIVVLEDDSVWRVGLDRIKTALWLPVSNVVACDDKLINTDTAEVAAARRLH
jgi:hypothetical protein